jgi:predicted DNA-binding protein with PD1-like motif
VIRADLEIVALSGTVATGGEWHLHAVVAGPDGRALAGHVGSGCLVRTTAEIVLTALTGLIFTRELDARTGYRELAMAPSTDA